MNKSKFDPTKPYRYAMYARMSSDRQNPRSPDQQFATISETIERQKLPWRQVKSYRDDGISGRYVGRRLGLQEMLHDISSGALKVDLIIVDTFERFGRTDDMTEIRRKLDLQHGVLVVTADTGFTDPTTSTGKVLGMLENFRATEDTRVKGHNVRRGKRDAVREHKWPGGPPPFGYKLEPVFKTTNGRQEIDFNRLVPNEQEAWIVQMIFQKAADTGWGRDRLADAVNQDPAVPAELKPFGGSTVGLILKNEIYRGCLVYGRTSSHIILDRRVNLPNEPEEMMYEEGFCEPLVSQELWEAVAKLRAIRADPQRTRIARLAESEEN